MWQLLPTQRHGWSVNADSESEIDIRDPLAPMRDSDDGALGPMT
jgi:hypothetical protein